MSNVTLQELSKETVRTIIDLELGPGQDDFVAPNAYSIGQALVEPKAWYRAVHAGDEPVGFIMLYDDPDTPRYYLWRMMIAAGHQRKGYGWRALELLVDYVKTRPGATELKVSYVPGEGGPQEFYERFGFEPTGEMQGDEVVMRLPLD